MYYINLGIISDLCTSPFHCISMCYNTSLARSKRKGQSPRESWPCDNWPHELFGLLKRPPNSKFLKISQNSIFGHCSLSGRIANYSSCTGRSPIAHTGCHKRPFLPKNVNAACSLQMRPNIEAHNLHFCWNRTGILGCAASSAWVYLSQETQQIQECLCVLVAPRSRMAIEVLLNPADEKDWIQEKNLEFVSCPW